MTIRGEPARGNTPAWKRLPTFSEALAKLQRLDRFTRQLQGAVRRTPRTGLALFGGGDRDQHPFPFLVVSTLLVEDLHAQQLGALGVALVLAETAQGGEPRDRKRLAGHISGRRTLFRRLERAQEGEELRISPIARVVADDAQRLEPCRQPSALARAVTALLRQRELHLEIVAVCYPERGDLRQLYGALEGHPEGVGDLDALLAETFAQRRDDPLD